MKLSRYNRLMIILVGLILGWSYTIFLQKDEDFTEALDLTYDNTVGYWAGDTIDNWLSNISLPSMPSFDSLVIYTPNQPTNPVVATAPSNTFGGGLGNSAGINDPFGF